MSVCRQRFQFSSCVVLKLQYIKSNNLEFLLLHVQICGLCVCYFHSAPIVHIDEERKVSKI